MLQPGLTGAGCHCVSHPHHPHVCLEHAAFSWVLALGCVVAIPWTVGVMRKLLELARAAIQTTRWARSLDDGRTERAGDVEVRVSPSVGPRAFTVGAWRSAIVVGSGWPTSGDARRPSLHERARGPSQRAHPSAFASPPARCPRDRPRSPRQVAPLARDAIGWRRSGTATRSPWPRRSSLRQAPASSAVPTDALVPSPPMATTSGTT
jgi:hypothetical protein